MWFFLYVLGLSIVLPTIHRIVSHIDNPLGVVLLSPTQGRLTSTFGPRYNPITLLPETHYGIDLAAPKGTRVIAVLDGVVSRIGNDVIAGVFVEIQHSKGVSTFYGHLLKPSFSLGVGTRD